MQHLMTNIFGKRRYWVLKKDDVIKALTAIDNHRSKHIEPEVVTGNCGWVDEEDMWYLFFNASNKQWVNIIKDLSSIGLELVVRSTPEYMFLTRKD